MYRRTVFVCIAVIITAGQIENVSGNLYNPTLSMGTYFELNEQQHKRNLQEYDNQMESFKQTFDAGLNALEILDDMLINSLAEAKQRLDTLQASGAPKSACVSKYRHLLPSVTSTKSSLSKCTNAIKNQQKGVNYLNDVLLNPKSTRNYLERYYNNIYDGNIKNCKYKFDTAYYYTNYTMCVWNAIESAETYTIQNQKAFAEQMDEARCSANIDLKQAMDCHFSVQNRTISQITETNTLVNKCALGQDECKQCYTCPYNSHWLRTDINYYSPIMRNPFYGLSTSSDCVMLIIV